LNQETFGTKKMYLNLKKCLSKKSLNEKAFLWLDGLLTILNGWAFLLDFP